MKKQFIAFLFFIVVCLNFFGQTNNLRQHFFDPPFEYGPWVFWMWMNGNITREGITLDLEAMHRVGISGAVLFTSDVGIPQGAVEYGSREWLDLNKYMFAEAKRLDMKIMLHNGPGYSITGAPWITPENSMQQIVWTETFVSEKGQIKLPRPYAKMGYYEDAMVIAYPSLKGEDKPMQSVLNIIRINGSIADKELLFNYDYDTFLEINVPQGQKQGELLFEFNEPFEASSIVVRREHTEPPHHPYDGPRDDPPTYVLEYSEDGVHFQRACQIGMPALRELNVPTSSNFNTVKAKYYRLLTNKDSRITELNLYTAPRLKDWESKANYITNGNRNSHLSVKEIPSDYIINPDEVIDITQYMSSDGTLNWEVPRGNWTILRIGHTTTGEENAGAPFNARGLECDKLSKRGIRAHYDEFLKPLFKEMKEFRGNSFYGIAVDSWEAGTQNWTKDFDKEYQKRNQRSIVPYIAAFTGRIVGGTSSTESFLADIRQIQGTMLAENFYQELRNICHQNDLCFLNESYGDGPFNSLEVGKYVDIPTGEFWVHGLYGGSHTNNQAGYIARTNNRKIAGAEAYTAMPDLSKFTEYPAAMKGEGDWMFTNGINRFMFHTFAHQPHPTAKPGMTMGPFGTHMNRNQTWWEQSKPYMDYIRRCQYMLQEGRFISSSSPWVPNDNTIDPTQKKDDFEYYSLDENAIINYMHRQQDNMDYYFVTNNKRNPVRIIAIFDIQGKQPEIWYPETGAQIPVYNYKTENGKTVIPLNLTSSESVFIVFNEGVKQIPIWNEKEDLRQIKIQKQSLAEIHDSFTISVWLRPDVVAVNGRSYILYPQNGEKLYGRNHASIGLAVGQNIIKIFEQAGERAKQVLTVDTKIEGWSLINVVYENRKPIVYLNGKKIGEGEKSRYTVHPNNKELAAKDQMITIFQGEYEQPQIQSEALSAKDIARIYKMGKVNINQYILNNRVKIPNVTDIIEIKEPWTIVFPENSGAPKKIVVKELESLHLNKNSGVKYFSGTATYSNKIVIPQKLKVDNNRLILDLGNVAFFAQVSINEKPITTLWKAPYTCDITNYAQIGDNKIEVKVTNLWTNRLIGDEFLPQENNYDKWGELDKFPDWYKTNQPYSGKRNTFVAWKQYNKNSPLTESGLIGPVQVISITK